MAYDVVRELTSPEGILRVAYRGVGDKMWIRLVSVTSDGGNSRWPCWVDYDDLAGLRQLPVELAQPPRGQPPAAVVAASYGVGKRALSGFTVSLAELPGAIERAGGDPPPELGGLGALPGAITTRFSDGGVPVSVQAPPVDERLTFRNSEDFEAAMRSCGGD